ncbi:MAG: hypothetical protein GMKNLPBB_02823 [Myxococcota bacterium]|nr:hypothetical protein [Myxococcota bacterium]
MKRKRWNIPELEEISHGIVRIPERVGVPFTPRVRRIADHSWFQRLRLVRQLGPLCLVYPGAMHTRFEHSLGVLSRACACLRALEAEPDGLLPEIASEYDVRCCLAAALLHDMGHFPFAHAFEELAPDVFHHARFSIEFIRGTIVKRSAALKHPEPLPGLLRKEWEVEPDDVAHLLNRRIAPVQIRPEAAGILRGIVDGPVDADKLDYLQRDSLHCGVPYGRFLDEDRFLSSLTVDPVSRARLALTEKGRISAELFLFCRYAMFSEVYWHHSGRSFTAMINAAVAHAANTLGRDVFIREFFAIAFQRGDDDILKWLAESGAPGAIELINHVLERRIFKRFAVIESGERQQHIYSALMEARRAGRRDRLTAFHGELLERLIKRLGMKIQPWELLLDIPDPEKDRAGDLPFLPGDGGPPVNLGTISQLWQGVMKDFPRWVRKIRFFVAPRVADAAERKLPRGQRTLLVQDALEFAGLL